MTEFIWQLPNNRDARYADATARKRGERLANDRAPFTPGVSDPRGTRFNYFDYLHQVARAADLTGFDGIRIQNDPEGDEPWIIAGYVAPENRHVKLLTEFDASRGSAVYAAKNAMSFQRFTGDRFAWQISSVDDPKRRLQLADKASNEQLLPRIDEFLSVARGVVENQSGFNFKGEFFEVLNGGFAHPLGNHPLPEVYLSGESSEALQLSVKHADVHVFAAAPVAALSAVIADLKGIGAGREEPLRLGLRIDLLIREDNDEAVFDARRLAEQTGWQGTPGADGFWPGLSNPGSDAAGTLVGSYDEVSQQLLRYARAGISSFLLGGSPHLEEAYRAGENLLPRVRAALV
jgi:alkanesulfonate monooxygenase